MKYIVEDQEIIDTVRSALESEFSSLEITNILMKNIENNIWTVLEDDCEEFIDEDWEYKGD